MEIRTTDGRHVNTLPRSYGNGGPTVRNPATLLPALARKPNAWNESPLRGELPNGWIGNGVLDRFLEDESLFGEFLRAPVSEGGVEPLVVEPPHVVVEVGA